VNTDAHQRVPNLIQLEWFDDRHDVFHWTLPPEPGPGSCTADRQAASYPNGYPPSAGRNSSTVPIEVAF
jgi:hypothetical protein